MSWVTRLAAFVLSLFVGTSIWFLAAKLKSARAQTVQTVSEPSPPKTEPLKAAGREESLVQAIQMKLVNPIGGYANVRTMTLRERPDADAPVAATIKVDDYTPVQILGGRDGFLQVSLSGRRSTNNSATEEEQRFEGWTAWGSVVPESSAIVMDAGTGAVVGRVPLSGDVNAVAYSPDGTRATFYSTQGGQNSCEVRTSDYTLTKCFALAGLGSYNTIFYGPSDGALYAAVLTRGDINVPELTRLTIVRVGDEGESEVAAEIPGEPGDFAVSPDGLTGFVLHREDQAKQEMTVDVVDLGTFRIRNSFTLHGVELPTTSDTFVVNHDGTELYSKLYGEGGTVFVTDTGTGKVNRVLSFNASPRDYWYFDGGDLVGDSLLLRIWNQDQDEIHTLPHVYWLGSGGRVAAEKGIYLATGAGDARYAVNEHGTRLFKLDSNNRIRKSLNIDRSEFRNGLTAETELGTFTLSASPDGKRLILLVGVEDGC